MYLDYHLHSQYSRDSKTTLDLICEQAIAKGLKEIAITDHVDFAPVLDPSHMIGDYQDYFHALQQAQLKWDGQLTIRIGMEAGMDVSKMPELHQLANAYPFDFIIASIHQIGGTPVSREPFYENITSKTEAYHIYYQELMECIARTDDFNVIGHLDYCKRYVPYEYEDGDQWICHNDVKVLLQLLIEKGKGIEVNTSTFRHVSNMCMPHYDIIQQYYQLGGRRITIGSDSHRDEYVGFHVDDVEDVLKQIGFTHISSFSQRKEIPIAL